MKDDPIMTCIIIAVAVSAICLVLVVGLPVVTQIMGQHTEANTVVATSLVGLLSGFIWGAIRYEAAKIGKTIDEQEKENKPLI